MSGNMALVRAKADEMILCMLRNNPRLQNSYATFKSVLQEHDNGIRETVKQQKISYINSYLITEKTVADFYRRMGNMVIQRALQLKKEKRQEQRNIKRKAARPVRRRR